MEDFQSHRVHALSAHMEGLEAALEALPTEPETGASLRRIARSLSLAAAKVGASDLSEAAQAVEDADDESLAASARHLLARFGQQPTTPDEGPIRVLLVEDNRTAAAAVQAYLKGPGFVVHHAEDAASAERLLHEEAIDIVLLDLILPDRDGRDLLIQMREDRATAEIPVIVLSAKEGAVPRAECLAVGASQFLEKPVAPDVLRAEVMRHAETAASRVTARADGAPDVPGRAALVEAYEPLRLETSETGRAAVALLAVNDFEAVAQALGDEAADDLVAAVAGPVGDQLEDGRILGRWGRSQLVMLLPSCSAAEARLELRAGMTRLAASAVLEETVAGPVDVSFSAGVAVARGDEDLRDVVSAAEESMYRARSTGRGILVTPDEPAPDRKPLVLLVEDDRVTATLIHHRLVREGFDVMDFVNGEDAFQWATDGTFDLAILDVKVPGMDGFELLERLRGIERLDAVPIVMLTGLGGEADVIRGLELGANDYMLKPFSPTELLARVRRLIYSGGQGASEAGGPDGSPAEVAAR